LVVAQQGATERTVDLLDTFMVGARRQVA